MGRAIVRHPQAFLMDEPLSNLDAKLRVQMRSEIARIQHDLGVTTIYVTHDQTEAMTMGDRVAVIRKGELQQVDTPQALYEHPVNLFVAGFIGSPAMNLVRGHARRRRRRRCAVEFGGFRLPVPAEVVAARPGLRGVRRPDDRARHPARGHGGRVARVRRARRAPDHVDRRAARGARAPTSSCTSPSTRRRRMTDDVQELAVDVGAEALEQVEQQAAGGRSDVLARLNPRTTRAQGRADRAGGRHPPPALLRPRQTAPASTATQT